MNLRMLIAVVLIVAGIIALAYQGFTYTTREHVIDVGPVHAEVEKKHTIPVAPVVGGVAVAAGVVLLLINRKSIH